MGAAIGATSYDGRFHASCSLMNSTCLYSMFTSVARSSAHVQSLLVLRDAAAISAFVVPRCVRRAPTIMQKRASAQLSCLYALSLKMGAPSLSAGLVTLGHGCDR